MRAMSGSAPGPQAALPAAADTGTAGRAAERISSAPGSSARPENCLGLPLQQAENTVAGVMGSEGAALDPATEWAITSGTGGRPLDAPLRGSMEAAFGADFSTVRVHDDPGAYAPNQKLGAEAFTAGNQIFFGQGSYPSGAPDGQHVLAHERAHVLQQGGGGIGGRDASSSVGGKVVIQRLYSGLDTMGKARVDQQAEETYAQKAAEFEFKMAPTIMSAPAANVVVDVMLARVKQIVDAWAASTGRKPDATYEREFGWAGGDQYYGALAMTADNIKQVFGDTKMPMRSKLKIVYNAVRNNNLQKWLKLASIELDRQAKGQAPRDSLIKTATTQVTKKSGSKVSLISGRAEKETVKPGFAVASGLQGWLSSSDVKTIAGLANTEKMSDEWFGTKRDTFGHDRFSKAMNFQDVNAKASAERSGNASGGLALTHQRTLTVGDVPDITEAEIEQHYLNTGKPAPDAVEKLKFKSAVAEKMSWSQGGEYFDINLGSDSAKAAAEVKARMEAGISGSTDLMLHAAKYLGLDGDSMKKLRLALAGWMMANRDHSFYEVYRAAEAYGPRFVIDKNDPGQEYENDSNLYPMNRDNFIGLLTGGFPKHFLSMAYKDDLSDKLGAAKTAAGFKDALKDQGLGDTDLATLDERGLAELSRLGETVAKASLPSNDEPAELNQAVRRLRQTSSYWYLGNTLGADKAQALLNVLIRKHHFGLGRGASTDIAATLEDAGLPASIVAKAKDTGTLNDLNDLRLAVDGGTDLASAVRNRLQLALGSKEFNDVLAVLTQTYKGTGAITNPLDRVRADNTRRWAQFERIAQMVKTTGWWYSWNSAAYSEGVTKNDIRAYTAAVPSTQGPGLYLAKNAWASASYGDTPGSRLVAIKMDATPTIDKLNAAQKTELNKVKPVNPTSADILEKVGLYTHVKEIDCLLIYGGYARLNTQIGVTTKTVDLSLVPVDHLLTAYGKISEGAKQNLKDQLANYLSFR